MTSAELAVRAWLLVGMLAAGLATVTFLISVVLYRNYLFRLALRDRLRALAMAAMIGDDQAAAAELRRQILLYPLTGFRLVNHLLWLVRGVWKARLRQVVDDPAVLDLCRRLARRPRQVLGGLAPQVLGLAAHPEDLPLLEGLTIFPGAAAIGAAMGILNGWPVDHPVVRSVLMFLEETRPDLLRGALPHLDREAVGRQLPAWSGDPGSVPLAMFVAGRLDLDLPAPAIIAALAHPRAQVRRAACLAVRREEHRPCLALVGRLAELDGELQVRVAAIQVLGRLPQEGNLPVLKTILAEGPWLVQAHVVPAILAHGDAGRRLLARGPRGAWRSGAVRWIRELAPDDGVGP